MGIAASIPWPTFRAEYAEATLKMMHSSVPQNTARQVTSGTLTVVGTSGT